jgi:uncharacterized membrane protein
MPFCCKCGNQVTGGDQYCAKCGTRQGGAWTATDFAAGFSPRSAATLCYIPWVGWIAAIVVLASHTFRSDRRVRFHAFQGLYLFVAWLIVQWVFAPLSFLARGPHFHVAGLIQLAIVGVWIFMLVKTSHDEVYSLPVIGELAEKSLAE